MDPHRQNAYRHLLYHAMLDLRQRGSRWDFVRRTLRDGGRHARDLGELADWLHSMASFAARGFDGFDEKRFWNEAPSRWRALYERWFDDALRGQPGVWGGGSTR